MVRTFQGSTTVTLLMLNTSMGSWFLCTSTIGWCSVREGGGGDGGGGGAGEGGYVAVVGWVPVATVTWIWGRGGLAGKGDGTSRGSPEMTSYSVKAGMMGTLELWPWKWRSQRVK